MLYFHSFLFCGFVCMISQIILDNSKLTPGHITSILVVFGGFLNFFSIYDEIIKVVGRGALLPITVFGHSLIHWALAKAETIGILDLTAIGISAVIIFSFSFTLIFKPKNQAYCKYIIYWILIFIILISFITGNIILLMEHFQKTKQKYVIEDDEII